MKLNLAESIGRKRFIDKSKPFCVCVLLAVSVLFSTSCDEIEKPKVEPYYSETTPPVKQEFRWSNGKTLKSFDPALAAAPPETDVTRAIYEGLTDTNSKDLEPTPAIALKWSSEAEHRVWTFELRSDAKWSNGEPVKAEDFVRSWKRLAEIGDEVAHQNLLNNIVGMQTAKVSDSNSVVEDLSKTVKQDATVASRSKNGTVEEMPKSAPTVGQKPKSNIKKDELVAQSTPKPTSPKSEPKSENGKVKPLSFGVEAVSDFQLKVVLLKSDKNFPSLVAHPIFRPIYPDTNFEKLNADIVTNGAFRVSSVGSDGVTLDRSETYWNSKNVKLERVRFVPKENAEQALEAYRAGEIDAVTNAQFEPLALKLLMPFDDFKRTVHSALNFYEFNEKQEPFDDKRVREALAIAIERERLTEDEMDGSTKPAFGFQPYTDASKAKLEQDISKAQELLAEAGFPNAENFPKVRLLINRNNVQQRIARSVVKMWKQNLNIETEILVREQSEINSLVDLREFDLVRRGVVLPTSDETVNMLAIFSPKNSESGEAGVPNSVETFDEAKQVKKLSGNSTLNELLKDDQVVPKFGKSAEQQEMREGSGENDLIMTEDEAIKELLAIPLYFPTSYSLVKPYVIGFAINSLDASSLGEVSIDSYWQPSAQKNGL